MQKVRLKDVCESIFAGGDVPVNRWAKQKNNLYNIPIYTNGEKNNGLYGYTTESKINKPCVTISARGTIGYSVIRKEPFYPAIRLITVIPKSNCLDLGYLCNYLNLYSFSKSGTSIPQLTVPDVKNLVLYLPELNQQKSISKKIDKINQIISYRKCQLEKLDELIKSKFTEMFGDPQLNEKSWKRALLKDIAIGKLSYGSGASAIPYDGVTRYIRITDILGNGELSNDIKSPSQIDEKYILHNGDILFARSGATVGKTLCYNENMGKAIYAGYLIRLVPNPDKVLPIYVYYYTKTDYYKDFIQSNQKIVAQPNINAQEYGDLLICLPALDLQNQFADFVEKVEALKSKVKQSLAQLEVLKKSLMQKYFG